MKIKKIEPLKSVLKKERIISQKVIIRTIFMPHTAAKFAVG